MLVEQARPRGDEGAAASSEPTCFVFGGVAFEVHASPGLQWEPSPAHRAYEAGWDAGPVFARIRCVVAPAPELLGEGGREVKWSWQEDAARVSTAGVRAELRHLGHAELAATALIAPEPRGCDSLVTALVGAVADLFGALILHASGVDVRGEAVLFVGPSGAGKSTSANHCAGAAWFAHDRAIVFPSASGWHASPMGGGDPVDLPPSERRILPLGAVLRVRHGRGTPRLAPLPPAQALLILRESLQTAAGRDGDEQRVLDLLLALVADGSVGEVHNVLGVPLLASVEEWLNR